MGMKNWLKKTGAALSLAGALSGCDMLYPEGIPAKQDADGVVTQKEENEMGNILSSQEPVNDAAPFLPLFNDFNVFMGRELAAQGLDERRFDDELHVYMVRDEAEMAEKYHFGNLNWVPPAFHGDSNSTLYILKNEFMPLNFMMTLTHEAGHDFRSSAYEFPSKAHEMYFALKAYGLNRKIGSVFAGNAVVMPYPDDSELSIRCVPVNEYLEKDFHKYYFFGDLGFLVQANLENGNLEKAFNNILTRPILYLEETTKNVAMQHENICDASLSEFNKLLGQPGFRQGLLRHVSEKEAMEMINYLRFASTEITYYMLSDSGRPASAAQMDGLISQTETFYNSGIENTFFRNRATSALSYYLYSDVVKIANSGASRMEDKIRIHNISKRIIEMNRGFPCEYRFYDCMGDAAEPRATHVLGYLSALAYSTELINAGIETHASLIALPEEFDRKFYPTRNYHYEDTSGAVAVYSPNIFFSAGVLEEDMAHIALSGGDNAQYGLHMCKAIEWFMATLEAGCSRVPDTETSKELKAECEAAIGPYVEQSAQISVDNSREFYDENCRIY